MKRRVYSLVHLILLAVGSCTAIAEDWASIDNELAVFTDQVLDAGKYKEFPFVKRLIAERDLNSAFEMVSLSQYIGLQVAGLAIVEQVDPRLIHLAATMAIGSTTNVPTYSLFRDKIQSPVSVEQMSQAMRVVSTALPESGSVRGVPLSLRSYFYDLDPGSLEAWYTNANRLPCRSSVEYLALNAICASYRENQRDFTPLMSSAIERGRTLPGVPTLVYLSLGDDRGENYRRCLKEALIGPGSRELVHWAITLKKAKFIRDNMDLETLSTDPEVLISIKRQLQRLDKP